MHYIFTEILVISKIESVTEYSEVRPGYFSKPNSSLLFF